MRTQQSNIIYYEHVEAIQFAVNAILQISVSSNVYCLWQLNTGWHILTKFYTIGISIEPELCVFNGKTWNQY